MLEQMILNMEEIAPVPLISQSKAVAAREMISEIVRDDGNRVKIIKDNLFW